MTNIYNHHNSIYLQYGVIHVHFNNDLNMYMKVHMCVSCILEYVHEWKPRSMATVFTIISTFF